MAVAPQLTSSLQNLLAGLPPAVRLVAVSKTVASEQIRWAYDCGVRDFGESRLQEALPKMVALADLDITWHFIGRLQANKARRIIEHFSWIHSVTDLAIASRLNKLAAELQKRPQVCLQVKLWQDDQKLGWSEAQLGHDLNQLQHLDNLDWRGLMAILPVGLRPPERLEYFQSVAHLAQRLRAQSSLPLRELSLGMSGDYKEAIAARATMVRLGSIIFGARPSPGSI